MKFAPTPPPLHHSFLDAEVAPRIREQRTRMGFSQLRFIVDGVVQYSSIQNGTPFSSSPEPFAPGFDINPTVVARQLNATLLSKNEDHATFLVRYLQLIEPDSSELMAAMARLGMNDFLLAHGKKLINFYYSRLSREPINLKALNYLHAAIICLRQIKAPDQRAAADRILFELAQHLQKKELSPKSQSTSNIVWPIFYYSFFDLSLRALNAIYDERAISHGQNERLLKETTQNLIVYEPIEPVFGVMSSSFDSLRNALRSANQYSALRNVASLINAKQGDFPHISIARDRLASLALAFDRDAEAIYERATKRSPAGWHDLPPALQASLASFSESIENAAAEIDSEKSRRCPTVAAWLRVGDDYLARYYQEKVPLKASEFAGKANQAYVLAAIVENLSRTGAFP